MSYLDKVRRELESILGNVHVELSAGTDNIEYEVVFPENKTVHGSVPMLGVLSQDVGGIIFDLLWRTDAVGGKLMFVNEEEGIVAVGYSLRSDGLYERVRSSVPLLVTSKGNMYDLKTMEKYSGEDLETLKKIYGRYKHFDVVVEYLRTRQYISIVWFTVWRSNGLREMVYQHAVAKPVGRREKVYRAVFLWNGEVTATYMIDDVVAETAIGIEDPKTVGMEFLKTFKTWLEKSCREAVKETMRTGTKKNLRLLSGLPIDPLRLKRGLEALGLEELDSWEWRELKLLSRMSWLAGYCSECAEDGVIITQRGAIIGTYKDIIDFLHSNNEILEKKDVTLDMLLWFSENEYYRGLEVYRYLRKWRLEDMRTSYFELEIGDDHIPSPKAKIMLEFMKKYGLDKVEKLELKEPLAGYKQILVKSKSGMSLLI